MLDGRLVNSCLVLAAQAAGRSVITIEGIRGADGGPNDLQQDFIDYGAVQCGYCIPGMVLAGEALLARTLTPNRHEIREAIAGNLCRCTGYQQIVDAIEATATQSRRQRAKSRSIRPRWLPTTRRDARIILSDLKYVGKPARRVDALEKVLGTAKYIGDYRLPGMLYAALSAQRPAARPHRPAGRGACAAGARRGGGHHRRGLRRSRPVRLPRVRTCTCWRTSACATWATPSLRWRRRTRRRWQPGWRRSRCELEPLPGVFDPEEALQPGSPLVGEQPWDAPTEPRGNLLVKHIVRKGDPEAVLAGCEVLLDEEYSTAHQEHAYIETEAALAVPWPGSTGVTVYSPSQSPFNDREQPVPACWAWASRTCA